MFWTKKAPFREGSLLHPINRAFSALVFEVWNALPLEAHLAPYLAFL